MNTIVLLGFSTAGKSHFKEKIGENNPDISTADSDKFVAKEYGNIYSIYNTLGYCEAINYITKKEEEFLSSINMADKLLIAAGPFLVNHKAAFNSFNEKFKPEYFYLKRSPENIYQDLIKRHERQKKDSHLFNNPNFACWDVGVTVEKVGDKIQLIDNKEAINNIIGLLKTVETDYMNFSKNNIIDADKLRTDDEFSANFYNLLLSKLK